VSFTVEIPPQADPQTGRERILVHFDDGSSEELRLHDYERVYALAGLYEEIVQRRLDCRSPDEIASMLADATDSLRWERSRVRVLDIGAGNGISGEALAALGMRPVVATDLEPAARDAAMRDRPGVYDAYLTTDLIALSPAEQRTIRELTPNALTCVAPVGAGAQHVPPSALATALRLLAPDAVVAFMRDASDEPDLVTDRMWLGALDGVTRAQELTRHRYRHRYTVNRRAMLMEGVVWRISRQTE
jgi:SAM-dependent methyltransferase